MSSWIKLVLSAWTISGMHPHSSDLPDSKETWRAREGALLQALIGVLIGASMDALIWALGHWRIGALGHWGIGALGHRGFVP